MESKPFEGLYMLFVPELTYKGLSDAAKDRNITVAVLLQRSIDQYLASTAKVLPQLLTEKK